MGGQAKTRPEQDAPETGSALPGGACPLPIKAWSSALGRTVAAPNPRCPACQAESPAGKRFCGDCGAPLTPHPPGPSPTPAARQPAPPAERRQLTVLFCDLVGSTALSARLDPEDMRDVIAAYHTCVTQVMQAHGGYVAKYMGDGVLVYFGYPQAHEDDPERAVRAALALLEALAHAATAEPLQLRVGVASGLVVVGDLLGDGEAQERVIVGETPHLASRLQDVAEPNSVVISAGTRRLVGDLFECADLGAVAVKGYAEPVQAWRVTSASTIESRFEALRPRGLPLVGRDKPLARLLRHWRQAATRQGRVVLVSGEPGIGKSRLVAAFLERLSSEPHILLRYYGSPHHQDSPLYPVVSRIERAARFARGDAVEDKRAKLDALLAPGAPSDAERALFRDLLQLPPQAGDTVAALSPVERREQTLAAMVRYLERLAAHRPVLMIWEDVHWVDPLSRAFLDAVAARTQTLPVLLLLTTRPGFVPPWPGADMARITLRRLRHDGVLALIHAVAGGRALPCPLVQQIVRRTDGVPLFVEELTKAVLESGLLRDEGDRLALNGPLPALAVPSTLQASLMARLDRLPAVREVAQIGAVLGRQFSYELLAAAAEKPEDELKAALAQLIDAELIAPRGAPPSATYTFKHALVQDAAYATLLRGRRQALHARVARVLERAFPEVAQRQPEVMARHYAEAGLANEAASYAGRIKAARSIVGAPPDEAVTRSQT